MNHLRDLMFAALAGIAAAAIADGLARLSPPERVTMPDGTVERTRLSEADVAALLGGAR